MSIFDGVELTDEQKQQLEAKIGENYVSKTEFESVKTNRDETLTEKKREQEERRKQEDVAEAARIEAERAKAEKSGDLESLKSSYQEKIDVMQKQIESFNTEKIDSRLNKIATDFVNSNFVDDPVIRDAMTNKFKQRLGDDNGNTVVRDPNGNLTALSVEDLQTEFLANSAHKPHLVASNASGGGASGGQSSGGGAANSKYDPSATEADRIAHQNQRLKAAGLI